MPNIDRDSLGGNEEGEREEEREGEREKEGEEEREKEGEKEEVEKVEEGGGKVGEQVRKDIEIKEKRKKGCNKKISYLTI